MISNVGKIPDKKTENEFAGARTGNYNALKVDPFKSLKIHCLECCERTFRMSD
jgi:hypothetical protein